jgi:hypothetical protein
MSYWKIVAGHKYRAPDEVKSVTLGDWLRKNYIAIGWGEGNPQHKVFKNDMKIGDKVIVVTDGFIWAIGEITSDFKQVSLPEGSNLYENKRDVAINKLNAKQWESLVLALS